MKNKAPAEIQITAEQLLREAKERDLEIVPPVSILIDELYLYCTVYFRFLTKVFMTLIYISNKI